MTIISRHPLSALFSRYDLKGEALAELAENIQEHGQQLPIVLHEGMVLDGWNRYTACQMAGVEPITMDLADGQDPWNLVRASNMLRRHMTPAERVAVLLEKRQMEGEAPVSKLKIEEVAKDIEVSLGTAHKATTIAKANDPALVQALSEKKVSLDEAAKLAKLPEPERKAALEAPKATPAPRAPEKPQPVDSPAFEKMREELEAAKARIEELEGQVSELNAMMTDQEEAFNAARRMIEAENLLERFDQEIVQVQAMNKVLATRNNGLMVENADLMQMLKSARRKNERLEKALKAAKSAPVQDDEPGEPCMDPGDYLEEVGA